MPLRRSRAATWMSGSSTTLLCFSGARPERARDRYHERHC
jgi:hypothetical protein